MENKTQEQCKQDFEELIGKVLSKIDEIDNNTPWSECEPAWWLEMSDLRRKVYKVKEKMEIIYDT